jgi:MFS family permease
MGPASAGAARLSDWLGVNRATAGVLVVIGCLGLSEEIWSHFVALHLKAQVPAGDTTLAVAAAALYMGVLSSLKNLLEGAGYILGGTFAHRLGPRAALAVSVVPMAAGFLLMAAVPSPWAIVAGALLLTNWEPLSVPATFEIVGREVRVERRTIAFAVQSIHKRLPKVAGPAIGGLAFAVGYWLNLALAFGLVALAAVLQLALTRHLRPRPDPIRVPFAEILRGMPADLRRLLRAEVLIRWGDWFARDFAVLYVVALLVEHTGVSEREAARTSGWLLAVMGLTALATYVPVAKLVDRASSPRPFIGLTFLLFALFPIALVVLPRLAVAAGAPLAAGLAAAFVLNGLREIGEPARKALISMGFPPEIRARGIGLYWGLRSFSFCPAPLVAAGLWSVIGPDATFLLGGAVGLAGTILYARGSAEKGPA